MLLTISSELNVVHIICVLSQIKLFILSKFEETLKMAISKFIILNTGQKMPIFGIGTGKITDPQDIENVIDKAIEIGCRKFDTAYTYNNEVGIGKALKKHLDTGKLTREEIFVITKLPMIGMHPERVSQFLDRSLANLQLTYIDLYLIHWPVGLKFVSENDLMPRDSNGELLLDKETNLEEIWSAMEAEIKKGKVKAIGVSNFNQNQIQRILNSCKIVPTNLQVEVHAYFQQFFLREFCIKNNIKITAYAPLGSMGRRNYINAHKMNIPKLFEDPVVKKIAASKEKTPAQILLRFLIQGLGVSVIPKSVIPSRLKENYEIFDFELNVEEIERLKELDEGEIGRSCNSFDGAIRHPENPF